MSGADRLEDGYPHGTVEGFDRGCRSGYCPAGNEHGLSCRRAKRLAAGDYRYSRLVKRGMTPGEIADELGLVPETHEAPKQKVSLPAGGEDDVVEGDENGESDVSTSKGFEVFEPISTSRWTEGLSQAAARDRLRGIREWCRVNGFPGLSSKARIPQAALRAYAEAHPDGQPETYPGNDGTRVEYDPTHGRIDKDIQERVDEMKPTSLGQRVAMEATLQERRDREVASPEVAVLSPAEKEAVLTAIVHAPVVPDMETRAELFNEGFDEAAAQYGPVIDDLARTEGALELVLTKWNAERQRRLDAERLVFALSAEVRSLTEQLRRDPASFETVAAVLWKKPEPDERGGGDVISTGTAYRIEARVTPALRGAHAAARKPWWKRWVS
ncbi:hypothetical protein [Microbacterium sp.]|uniref:hypothetical protein n=1 Tax=Microbacterium sp. TaxID=51671 RepID=UPI0039E595B5